MKHILKFILSAIVIATVGCVNTNGKQQQGSTEDVTEKKEPANSLHAENHLDPADKRDTTEEKNRPYVKNQSSAINQPPASADEQESYVEELDARNAEYYQAYNNTLKLWNTPLKEMGIQTSLGIAHVVVCGPKDAEPIVLLHGMNASSTMWYPNIVSLSKNHRVYAIDNILEPGKSSLTGEPKNMEDIIKWYCEVLYKLDVKNYTLIGASKGGWLSTSIALREKWRIKNLILLSPAQTFIWIPPGSELLANISYSLDPKRKELNKVLGTMSINVEHIEKAFIDQYYIGTKRAGFSKFIMQMRPYQDYELRSLSMPVLLLIGDEDMINNHKSIAKAKRILPHPETGVIKKAGHFLSIDQSDIVNVKILDFLDRNK